MCNGNSNRMPKIQLYECPNFQGRMIELTGPTPHLCKCGFHDRISSIRVICGEWKLFEDCDFEGREFKVCEHGGPCCNGEYPCKREWCGMNNELASLYPVCRC
ncbi:MAG: beta/gamma crystallin family protein [Acetivibrio sp.]